MRRVFFSFDWDDVWRVNQVRNSWLAKGSYKSAGFVDSAEIEQLKKDTNEQIRKWIDKQLQGTSVTCVLVGSCTANSEWVNYEIQKSIEKKNGLLEVYIHNVKDKNGQTTQKGKSPFAEPPMNLTPGNNGHPIYPCYSYYDWVSDGGYKSLGDWIEQAAQQADR